MAALAKALAEALAEELVEALRSQIYCNGTEAEALADISFAW